MSVYKIYGSGTGGAQDSIASLDIQFDGEIVACYGNMISDADADDDTSSAEVSFLSTSSFAVNDARGSIMMIRNKVSLLTSGVYPNQTNVSVGGILIPISRGERIHLHINGTGSTVVTAHFYLYVNDRSDPRLRRRR